MKPNTTGQENNPNFYYISHFFQLGNMDSAQNPSAFTRASPQSGQHKPFPLSTMVSPSQFLNLNSGKISASPIFKTPLQGFQPKNSERVAPKISNFDLEFKKNDIKTEHIDDPNDRVERFILPKPIIPMLPSPGSILAPRPVIPSQFPIETKQAQVMSTMSLGQGAHQKPKVMLPVELRSLRSNAKPDDVFESITEERKLGRPKKREENVEKKIERSSERPIGLTVSNPFPHAVGSYLKTLNVKLEEVENEAMQQMEIEDTRSPPVNLRSLLDFQVCDFESDLGDDDNEMALLEEEMQALMSDYKNFKVGLKFMADSDVNQVKKEKRDVVYIHQKGLFMEENADMSLFIPRKIQTKIMDRERLERDFPGVRKKIEKEAMSYVCKYCGREFERGCALGGHISRIHKGQSTTFQNRQMTRKERTGDRARGKFINSAVIRELV